MTRRAFITFLGGAIAAWPRAAITQSSGRLWKIGVLANEAWPPLEGLRHGLQDLGYAEGKSHLFVYRFAQGQAERAGRLFGAAARLLPATSTYLENMNRRIAASRTLLDSAPFEIGWAAGQAMTQEQAITLALQDA